MAILPACRDEIRIARAGEWRSDLSLYSLVSASLIPVVFRSLSVVFCFSVKLILRSDYRAKKV